MSKLIKAAILAAAFIPGTLAQAASPDDTLTPPPSPALPAAEDAAPKPKASIFMSRPRTGAMLMSELKSQQVMDAEGETLGGISDVLIDENGKVLAVTIGVGGFLGIGKKEIGVRYEALRFRSSAASEGGKSVSSLGGMVDEDAAKRVVLDVSREDIENAPEWTTEEATPTE